MGFNCFWDVEAAAGIAGRGQAPEAVLVDVTGQWGLPGSRRTGYHLSSVGLRSGVWG